MISFGLIALLGFTFLIVLDFLRKRPSKNSKGEVISRVPPSYPLVGHIHCMLPHTLLHYLVKFHREYGPNFDFYVFRSRFRVIGDPLICREILMRRPKVFRRTSLFDIPFARVNMPNNLFAAEGAIWSRARRLAAPHFSNQNLHSMSSIAGEESKSLVDSIIADGKTVHQMTKICAAYTSRVIGRAALGVNPDEMKEYFASELLFEDMNKLLQYLLERTLYQFPDWSWKYSSGYRVELDALKSNDRFDEQVTKHIRKVRDLYAKNVESKANTKLSLIESLIRESLTEQDKSSTPFTDQELLENVKALFIAGSETTAVTLAWAVYALCLHPQWLDALRSESDAIVGVRKIAMTYENFGKMANTLAVIKEAIRLYSAAPFIGVQLCEGQENYTATNELVISSSDRVFVNIDGPLMDGNVFVKPDEFMPERWIALPDGSNKEKLVEMESSFLAFGSGPRVCPGLGLALMEATVATAALVSNFNMTLGCPKEDVQRIFHFTAKPNTMPVIFSPRK